MSMTINDYDRAGGFGQELKLVRDVGNRLTALDELMPARPHREPEMEALANCKAALEVLRLEILKTRNT